MPRSQELSPVPASSLVSGSAVLGVSAAAAGAGGCTTADATDSASRGEVIRYVTIGRRHKKLSILLRSA